MPMKPQGKVKRLDDNTFVGAYHMPVDVMYDPGVDLFYLVDESGSTMEKLTPSDLEDRDPAIVKRFKSLLVRNPKKASKKKAKKKATKKRGKKKVTKKRRNPSMKRLLGRL